MSDLIPAHKNLNWLGKQDGQVKTNILLRSLLGKGSAVPLQDKGRGTSQGPAPPGVVPGPAALTLPGGLFQTRGFYHRVNPCTGMTPG